MKYTKLLKITLHSSIVLMALNSNITIAQKCDASVFENLNEQEKFIEAVKSSEFAFIGKPLRIYRAPGTPYDQEGLNAYVFEITEEIANTNVTHLEGERLAICGISPEYDTAYWPQDLGGEFVVTGVRKHGDAFITALIPIDNAMEYLYDIATIARAKKNN